MPDLNTLQWCLAAAGLVAILLGYWRKGRPFFKRFTGGLDVLVGRTEFTDVATGKKVPAIPPLGTALAEMREDITVLTTTVAVVADQQVQIKDLVTRVTALEAGMVERIVTKAESAAMWQAVAGSQEPKDEETPT